VEQLLLKMANVPVFVVPRFDGGEVLAHVPWLALVRAPSIAGEGIGVVIAVARSHPVDSSAASDTIRRDFILEAPDGWKRTSQRH
jgi:hypothetical protein